MVAAKCLNTILSLKNKKSFDNHKIWIIHDKFGITALKFILMYNDSINTTQTVIIIFWFWVRQGVVMIHNHGK